MAIDKELPVGVSDFSCRVTSVPVAGKRDGEALLFLDAEGDCPPALGKLYQAILSGGLSVDGVPVRAKAMKRADDETRMIYLDWTREGNESLVAPELGAECYVAVGDGMHNSNSHLVHWRGQFWLIHASSPYHFATPECKLVLWRSADAKAWTQVRTFSIPDEDIRDPKFSVIHGKLFIYILKSFVADGSEPYTTCYTFSEDGEDWAPLTDLVENQGWLFWNPKTIDEKTWYVPAYWSGHGNSVMFRTQDGEKFSYVCHIHRGKVGLVNDRNDETDFDFLGDGTMISTQRLEFSEDANGDPRACTNIAICRPPYTAWETLGKDYHTRLDGPSLFAWNGRVYAVGRRNPYTPEAPNYVGSVFGRKRTSLYEVTEKGLVFLSDFPSAGDTSYGGCVLKDGYLYASYYSSTVEADWPWYVGMLSPSDIRIAKVALDKIEALADANRARYEREGLYMLR
jgi:hypothetical protein